MEKGKDNIMPVITVVIISCIIIAIFNFYMGYRIGISKCERFINAEKKYDNQITP